MKRSELNFQRLSLEKIYGNETQNTSQKTLLIRVLSKVWRYLLPLFKQKQALIVRQQCDRAGTVFWNAYNPTTGCSKDFSSTAALLSWLEQHSQ